jgi:hypothetical protein
MRLIPSRSALILRPYSNASGAGMSEGALVTMGAGSPFARPAGSLGTLIPATSRTCSSRWAQAGRTSALPLQDVLKDDPARGTIWKRTRR